MGIPYSKIEDLIEVCRKVDEKVYEDDWDKRIHVRDIEATLQKLIDDDLAELEALAEQFIEQELLPICEAPSKEELNLLYSQNQ